ncbi:MAG: hypothetical protein IKE36_05775 [Solobacterium sp.]|nr:hypothetical protein [Solobacterium sp.]
MIAVLLLTIFWECIAAGFLGIAKLRDYLLITVANILTNPALNLLFRFCLGIYPGFSKILFYILLEPVVVFIEYLFYKKFMKEIRNPLVFSLILNLVSVLGGELCLRIF